jgi:hypothetical protein
MSGIQQMLTGGTYKAPGPTTIGQAYGGGFYAGKISTTANGVATHYLIVAPKSSGQSSKSWGPKGVDTNVLSTINGPTNSASLAALGAAYAAAVFCEGLTIGGYSDWYLPSQNELEVLYYFLKPGTTSNNVGVNHGNNVNAVSPEPYNTYYTSGSPSQTSAGADFIVGGAEAMTASGYCSSTESNADRVIYQSFDDSIIGGIDKNLTFNVRAIRRIPV